jgi:secretion system chaperone SscA
MKENSTEQRFLKENNAAHEENIENLYATAYTFYQQKQFAQADSYFRMLVFLQPHKEKFWKGLAACLQMQQEHQEALECYKTLQQLTQSSVEVTMYMNMADCYFALKQIDKGLKILDIATQLAQQSQDSQALMHSMIMREAWSKKI